MRDILKGRNEMATIYDVAKKSGYSSTVVSHALSGNPRVSEKAKAIILAAAKELGYEPSILAQELGWRKTKLLGIVVRDIIYPFFPSIVEGIEETAFNHGYTTILCNSAGKVGREAMHLDVLRRRKVAGIILSPVQGVSNNSNLIRDLLAKGTHVAFFDRKLEGVRADSVLVDDMKGAYLVTKYLIELGHQRIGLVVPAMDDVATRITGYRRGLEEAGLLFDESLVSRRDAKGEEKGKIGDDIDGYEGAKALLARSDRPTAIFATNDIMAFGAEKAIKEAGLRIPEDVSLVGFDNIRYASYLGVPLTTVSQPTYVIGQRVASILISKIEAGGDETTEITLEPEIVIRESTGRAV